MKKSWMMAGLAVWGLALPPARAAAEDLQAQVAALQQRIAQLEAQRNDQAVSQRSAELVRQMVRDLAQQSYGPAADTSVTAGYDQRFFIKSTDDQFLLQFDTLLQFRHTMQIADDGNDKLLKTGEPAPDHQGVHADAQAFELERARVYLQGRVLKDLKYKIVLEGDDDSTTGDYLYEYILSYSFMPELGVQVGRFEEMVFGAQKTTSIRRQTFVDRALATQVFNVDRVTGVALFGTLDLGDVKPAYQATVFNDFRNMNNAPFSQNDNSPGVAARVAAPLLGATTKDFDNESDLEFHENPVMQLGGSLAYANDRNERSFAGGKSDSYPFLGRGLDGRTDVYKLGGEATMLGADATFKHQGLSVLCEGFYQHVTANEFLAGARDFTGTSTNRNDGLMDGKALDNYGWYAQAGYFVVPSTFELAARVGGVCVDNSNDSYEYAGGWNWYLNKTQDLKLSMDVTYIDRLPIKSSGANYDGVQNQSLFLVRTQLQFQF